MKNSIKMTASALVIALGMSTSGAVAEDIVTDRELVAQAQEIMYNLNYDVGPRDGVMNEETRNVIRTLQRKLDMQQTGNLTVKLLLELRAQKISKTWGAISAAVDGGWGATWNYETRSQAEGRAIELCNSKSEKNCKVLAVYDQQCAAAYHWDGEERWGWRGSTGTSIDRAKLEALEDCRKHRSEPAPCELMTAICADGRHKN